ncbi:DUF6090 family protein [Constantimarinum furrinae]|uniref:Uncharacterized protein n=1 Tax=Constantimarinum furrinae TaxID=2562285 RepID=A0A7G8PXU7_9FLAO|nr:DUF6090 family protein [Constantimarinum furrinae]QNJ99163.1 hypothetical protein ALE3EI_2636 [Constantimarinum furrinae]
MPLFTKSFKIKSLNNKRFGRYLLYALGEIILVVTGILIALQINNHNEENKKKNLLNGILQNVSYDLQQDTLFIGTAIKYYDARSKVALKILNNEYDAESVKKCILCGNLVSTYLPLTINDKGYHQLKNFYEESKGRDSLTVDIVQFYTAYEPLLSEFGDQVKNFSLENIREWRDTKPWFSEIMANKGHPDFFEYLLSQDYKNKVAYFNIIACNNYMNMLKQYKIQATEALKRIDKRLEETD